MNTPHIWTVKSVLLPTLLLVSASATWAQVSLSLSSTAAPVGSNVTLNLALNAAASHPAGLQWRFSYSTADFSALSLTAGASATAAGKFLACYGANGSFTCLLSGFNTSTIPNGVVATIALKLSAGSKLSRQVQVTNVSSSSASATTLTTFASGGVVTVPNQTVTPSALGCSPSSLGSGASSLCTVTLSKAAPTGGTVVTLIDNSSLLTTPASVTVPAGATTATFTGRALTVTTSSTVILTASVNGSSVSSAVSLLAPLAPTALTCNPTTLTSGASGICTVLLNTAAPSTGAIVTVYDNSALLTSPTSVTVRAGATTATFTTVAGAVKTAQTAVVTATLNGTAKTASIALTSTAASTCPCSIWKPTAAPTLISDPDTTPVELGMKFKSNVAGYILGLRFYKGSQNTGTHTGHLWTRGGSLLATVNFANETGFGWQQANFSAPVAITAKTTYVISYWAPSGHYPDDSGYFNTAGVDSGPLHAMKDGEDGYSDVYSYAKTIFPTSSWNSSNYWVDVVFNTVASTRPTVVTASLSEPKVNKTAMAITTIASWPSSSSAALASPARSLSCAPSTVRPGDSFTCELSLSNQALSRANTFAVVSSSSDVRLPSTISARADQRSIKFSGTVDRAAAQSSISILIGNPGERGTETQLAVLPSTAPVLSLPTTLLVKSGQPLSFRVSALDPSGLPVRISASELPVGAAFSSGRFDWTPAPNQNGSFGPVFSAVNSAGYTAASSSQITVGSGLPVIANSSQIACSPGAIATLTGAWLSLADQDLSDPTGASTQLDGTTVRINGAVVPVLFASPARVEFQCPSAASGSGLEIKLETPAGATAQVHTTMLDANPVLLTTPSASPDQGQITVTGADRLATTRDWLTSGEPAQLNDLVSLRATGLGAAVGTAALSVKVGGIDAQVLSIVPAPDAAGVYLIHVRIPSAAPLGDAIPVQLELTSSTGRQLSSNKVTLAIE